MAVKRAEKHEFVAQDIERILNDLGGGRYSDIQVLAMAVRATHLEAEVINLQTQLLVVKNTAVLVAGLVLFGRFRLALVRLATILDTIKRAIATIRNQFPDLEKRAADFLDVLEETGGLFKDVFGTIGAIVALVKVVYTLNSQFVDELVIEIKIQRLSKGEANWLPRH